MCIYNGEQYNSDTARIISKFDIYFCDLGDFDDGLLGKERPCVIIKNNDEISPKTGQYLIAPIRTEHQMEVNKDTLEDIVNEKRRVGRIYVPIEMQPGDYRFVDVSQMRTITSTKVMRYYSSIINRKVRNRINIAMAELQFSDEELAYISHERFKTSDSVSIVEEPVAKSNTDSKVDDNVESLHEIDSNSEMAKKINKAIQNQNVIVNEQKFVELYNQVKRKEIAKSTAAKKLGLTIKAFEQIAKEMNKEKGEKKRGRCKPGTYNGFSVYYKMYTDKKMSVKEIAQRLGVTEQAVRNKIYRYRKDQNDLAAKQNKPEYVNPYIDATKNKELVTSL